MNTFKSDDDIWTLHDTYLGVKIYKSDVNPERFSAYLWSNTNQKDVDIIATSLDNIKYQIAESIAPDLYSCLETIREVFAQSKAEYTDPVYNVELLREAIAKKISELL